MASGVIMETKLRAVSVILAGVFVVATLDVARAAVTYPVSGPYTFTGVVNSASGPCVYAVKAKIAGYTALLGIDDYSYPGGKPDVAFHKGLVLVISSGPGVVTKTVLGLPQLEFLNGSTSASGKGTLTTIPSTNAASLSYKFTVKYDTSTSFVGVAILSIGSGASVCHTVMTLTFTKGLPNNIANFL